MLPQGFVKVITDKKYGETLEVHIIGPKAELINEALQASSKWKSL